MKSCDTLTAAVRSQPTDEGGHEWLSPTGSTSTKTGHLLTRRRSAPIPDWSAGDSIPLGLDRSLRVIEVRPGAELDDDPVLVVETI